jgi:hypothetical protein
MANLQSSTVANSLVVNGTSTIQQIFEKCTLITAGAAGTISFDLLDQAVIFYGGDSTANFTISVRGNSTTTLNSVMNAGQSATLALLVTNGSSARYPTSFSIDGVAQQIRWLNGANPFQGNPNSIDCYTFNILKTGSGTYVVLGSQTKYTTLAAIGGTLTSVGGFNYHTYTAVGSSTFTVY